MTKTTDWMQLISGKPFWPLEPDVERIDIRDIAWSLSMQCRFAGHTTCFYSVAEHCVHLSYVVPPQDALWALLHDATECYLVDLPRPVKRFLPQYEEAEARLLKAVAVRFGLSLPIPASVRHADTAILINERDALLTPSTLAWEWNAPPLPGIEIVGWDHDEACARFLDRFEELRSGIPE